MKILQVIPTLDQGGAEHFVFELTNALCKKGECCDVVTLFDVPSDNFMALQLLNNGVKIYNLGKKNGLDITIYYKLLKLIKNNCYDVVHSHVGAIKYTLLAAFALKKVSFFSTIHSEAQREAGKSIELWSRKILFKFGKCTPVTISEESEKSFEDFYGFKTIMIPNGVSEYEPGSNLCIRDNKEQLVFIHPASCQPVKNQALLFDAFTRLSQIYPNIKLIWVGSNNNHKELFDRLKDRMPIQASYKGVVSNVRDYMYAADAMCLSSKMEGLPMTVIEAFSVGCIPLCTPVGGCLSVINDGENGFLSEDQTVEGYYKMLNSFVQLSSEERALIKNNALLSFKKYSIKETCYNYLMAYRGKI